MLCRHRPCVLLFSESIRTFALEFLRPLKMKSYALWLMTAATGISAMASGIMTPENSIDIHTGKGWIEVTPVNNNIFKVSLLPEGDRNLLPESQAQVLRSSPCEVKTTVTPESIQIASPTTRVIVDRNSGKVSFSDSDGRLLLTEAEGISSQKSAENILSLVVVGDQSFYGAGERGHRLRLNGDTLQMYNRATYGYTASDPRISQMNITMPMLVSDAGYALLVDDYAKATLVISDTISYTTAGEKPLSYFFINGQGSIAGAVSQYTLLTGRMQLPPLWTLGYITSKYGYRSQSEALGAVDTLKSRGYPLDGIVMDLYWYGTETDMGRLEWDKDRFPDHRKMLADLKEKGVNTILISQPYINKKGAIDNYRELAADGLLVKDSSGRVADATTWVGDAGMLDVSNPETRTWMWKRYKNLTDEGVAAWWGDLGEPEVHPSEMVHSNGERAELYHNVYGNEWSRIIHEGFKKDYPDRRIMMMMRGGTAGLQRYNVFPWTGDVSRSWGGLQAQVNLLLNSGLSGMAYMGSDIGGFAVDPDNPTDTELYLRWMQFGVFSPTLRTHAQEKPEPYHYPEIEDLTRRLIKMRYEWLPYNYTLAYENVTEGLPLARPLNFRGDNPDEKYNSLPDEYMWGDEVLVAPVMHRGMRSRKVSFPAGLWYSFFHPDQPLFRGGSIVTVETPLDEVPLFVRAGAFIPLCMEPIENTSQFNPSRLTVKYFPSDKWSSYTLFDDDRISPLSIEEGKYRLTTFSGHHDRLTTEISIESNGGTYPGAPDTQILTFEVENIQKSPSKVELTAATGVTAIPHTEAITSDRGYGWNYDAKSKRLSIVMSWDFSKVTLTII